METPRLRLAAATANAGKAREFAAILSAALGGAVEVLPASGVAYPPEGTDYAENAVAKALAAAAATGLAAVADDSGLEVPRLGGWPGPLSARIGGTDAERRRVLLDRMKGLPPPLRAARFVCVAALARPGGAAETFRGEWSGRIVDVERGVGGFGFDPLFEDPETLRTAAEMTAEEKDARSHRGSAFRALAAALRR